MKFFKPKLLLDVRFISVDVDNDDPLQHAVEYLSNAVEKNPGWKNHHASMTMRETIGDDGKTVTTVDVIVFDPKTVVLSRRKMLLISIIPTLLHVLVHHLL